MLRVVFGVAGWVIYLAAVTCGRAGVEPDDDDGLRYAATKRGRHIATPRKSMTRDAATDGPAVDSDF